MPALGLIGNKDLEPGLRRGLVQSYQRAVPATAFLIRRQTGTGSPPYVITWHRGIGCCLLGDPARLCGKHASQTMHKTRFDGIEIRPVCAPRSKRPDGACWTQAFASEATTANSASSCAYGSRREAATSTPRRTLTSWNVTITPHFPIHENDVQPAHRPKLTRNVTWLDRLGARVMVNPLVHRQLSAGMRLGRSSLNADVFLTIVSVDGVGYGGLFRKLREQDAAGCCEIL